MRRAQPPEEWDPPNGRCECGCGEKTPIARQTRRERNQYAGYPLRYVRGHNPGNQFEPGARHPNWSGGTKVQNGYRLLRMPRHHLARADGYVLEHRYVWEHEHGRRLSPDEDVHHIDGDRLNNDFANLVALTKRKHAEIHGNPERPSREYMRQRWAERKKRRGRS